MNQSKRSKRSRRGRGPRIPRGMTNMNRVNTFRLTSTEQNLLSDSKGSFTAGYHSADPSGLTGSTWTAPEWSALNSLFSEVRCVSFKMLIVPVANSTTIQGHDGNTVCVSSVLSSVNTPPSTVAQVLDNADANFVKLFDTSSRIYSHTLTRSGKPQWASVVTPNPGSYAGCPGSIQWYGDGFTPNATLGRIYLVGIYEFRSRI